MTIRIEPYTPSHLDAVVQLSLRAWAPVFDSLKQVFEPEVYKVFYPEGWSASQRQAVEAVCAADDTHVWVALDNASPVGFVAVKLHDADKMGEIYMVAVDPAHQGRGIASELIALALDWMKAAGMAIAMVETGGDPGHAPARQTYEKIGFGLFPVARYFKKL
ncbi:MAG TPA: GNAT family N-acetyltransferase [Roseiflexaceae bacterium]|nr:GNAT family N-acetyltransferase [Roseiflexaceae bacterium]